MFKSTRKRDIDQWNEQTYSTIMWDYEREQYLAKKAKLRQLAKELTDIFEIKHLFKELERDLL